MRKPGGHSRTSRIPEHGEAAAMPGQIKAAGETARMTNENTGRRSRTWMVRAGTAAGAGVLLLALTACGPEPGNGLGPGERRNWYGNWMAMKPAGTDDVAWWYNGRRAITETFGHMNSATSRAWVTVRFVKHS